MVGHSSNARLVTDYVEVWNAREYAAIPEYVTESFALYEPAVPDGQVQGPAGLRGFLEYIVAAFPDFQVRITDLVADGETVMLEMEYELTHEGDFEGIPPTGRSVTIRGMEKLRLADGMIDEQRLYYDLADFFEQLGFEKPS